MYRDETSRNDVTQEGLATPVKQRIKEKTTKLMLKLGKMTIVANLAIRVEILGEVCKELLYCFAHKIHYSSFPLFVFDVFANRNALEHERFPIEVVFR